MEKPEKQTNSTRQPWTSRNERTAEIIHLNTISITFEKPFDAYHFMARNKSL